MSWAPKRIQHLTLPESLIPVWSPVTCLCYGQSSDRCNRRTLRYQTSSQIGLEVTHFNRIRAHKWAAVRHRCKPPLNVNDEKRNAWDKACNGALISLGTVVFAHWISRLGEALANRRWQTESASRLLRQGSPQ